MSKKSSDDQKGSSSGLNIRPLVAMITRFSGNSRRVFLLSLVMLILESVTAVLIPLLVPGYVVNFATENLAALEINTVVRTLIVVTLGLIILTMLNSLCDSLSAIYLAQGGRKVGYNMRVFLYNHLQKLSLSFHGKSRTGDILTRVTSDVAAVEDFIISNLSDFLGSALYLVFVLVGMFWSAWKIWRPGQGVQGDAAVFLIPLLAVSILPLMTVVSNYYTSRIKAASKR